MLELLLRTTKYRFIQGEGTDWLEGHHYHMEKVLGKGVIVFSNKRGGVMDVIFLGELSTTRKASIIRQVEDECGLVYIGQDDVFFSADYEHNLKQQYGDKVIIKK